MKAIEAIEIVKRLIARVELVYKTSPLTDKEPYPVTDALTLAISALEKQEADRWIPVTERPPENKKKVLVSYDTEDGKKVDISMFDKYGCLLGLVSAWRPLPEPYTEEDNDKP